MVAVEPNRGKSTLSNSKLLMMVKIGMITTMANGMRLDRYGMTMSNLREESGLCHQ